MIIFDACVSMFTCGKSSYSMRVSRLCCNVDGVREHCILDALFSCCCRINTHAPLLQAKVIPRLVESFIPYAGSYFIRSIGMLSDVEEDSTDLPGNIEEQWEDMMRDMKDRRPHGRAP